MHRSWLRNEWLPCWSYHPGQASITPNAHLNHAAAHVHRGSLLHRRREVSCTTAKQGCDRSDTLRQESLCGDVNENQSCHVDRNRGGVCSPIHWCVHTSNLHHSLHRNKRSAFVCKRYYCSTTISPRRHKAEQQGCCVQSLYVRRGSW